MLYSSTRNVLTFVNTTAIAYRQNSAFLPGSWHHAIVVVFTNVRTLRVLHLNTVPILSSNGTRLRITEATIRALEEWCHLPGKRLLHFTCALECQVLIQGQRLQ